MASKSKRNRQRRKRKEALLAAPDIAITVAVAEPAKEKKYGGGSIMNPPEREQYQIGGLSKILSSGAKSLIKKVAEGLDVSKKEIEIVTKEAQKRANRSTDEGVPYILDEGEVEDIVAMQRELGDLELRGIAGKGTLVAPDSMETILIEEFGYTRMDLDEIGESASTQTEYLDELAERIAEEGRREADFAEGGEVPVDTYPNIPPEEMAAAEASQLPDEQMEEDYVDFVMNEALDQEEQMYLMNALENDPQLSMIFDKVVDTASEFTGSGEVTGPGTGVSDSIPARLSDGEFVMTKKATDQIGADRLQRIMDEAERAYDGGLMRKDEEEELAGDMNKVMMTANQMPSLNVRQR